MIRRTLLLACALALSPSVGPSAAVAQAVRAYVTADSISVGERIGLAVVADRSARADVTFPTLQPDTLGRFLRFGDIVLLGHRGSGTRTLVDGTVTDSIVYEATTFALDTARVAAIPVLFTTASDTLVATTDPVLIPVRSVVPSDAEDIMDLMPIAEFRGPIWPWLLLVVVLLLALAAFIFWYRRVPPEIRLEKRQHHPSLPPHEEALERLKALADAPVDSDKTAEKYCVELSDLLRTYLWRRTAVHALEMTTGELIGRLVTMENGGAFPPDAHSLAEEILQTCDLAKFAEIYPSADACHLHTEQAADLVHKVEAFLSIPDAVPESENEDVVELAVETNDGVE